CCTPMGPERANGDARLFTLLLSLACAQNLLEAVSRGDAKKARQLLDWRADVDQRDKAQRSALHLAAAQGEEALTRLLLAFHADVDALDATQRTPLHWAQQQGHAPVAGALLQNWAKPLTDRPPKTPARRGEVPQAETESPSLGFQAPKFSRSSRSGG
ncbi:unnamed protein product, partial [Effrenium voratum]